MSTIGSSDDLQALRQEVSRLADENANLTAKLDIAPKSNNEVREMCRKLQSDNRRLSDAMERRTILGKQNIGSEELYRLREENKYVVHFVLLTIPPESFYHLQKCYTFGNTRGHAATPERSRIYARSL